MTKISILGDSISKGVIFDSENQRYKTIKDCYANLIKDKYNIDVLNYSKFGCTSTKAIKILEWNKEKVATSRYTIIELGGNDCDQDWGAISETPNESHEPNLNLEKFSENLLQIIKTVKAYGSTPIVFNLPPINADKYFDKVSEGKNKENILSFLHGDKEFVYRWHEAYNLAITKIAGQTNSILFDIRTSFLTNKDANKLICEDGIHPSEAGHQIIAKTLEETAKKFFLETGLKESA